MGKYVEYSFWIGLGKSVKNTAVILGTAALGYLISGINDWIPDDYKFVAVVVTALAGYLAKNGIEISYNNNH